MAGGILDKNKKKSEQPFRYGLLSLDVFEQLILSAQTLASFEQQLGGVLAISATSFVELPPWEVLVAALDTILINGAEDGTWTGTISSFWNIGETWMSRLCLKTFVVCACGLCLCYLSTSTYPVGVRPCLHTLCFFCQTRLAFLRNP